MNDRLFHQPGLVYFWALNDECDREKLGRMIEAFADADAAGVVLHPRPGLLVPYGGDEWFDLIRWIVERCAERNLPVWLYDEDPYPSGAAGGRVVMDHPDLEALGIEQFILDQPAEGRNLYTFPAGRLLWCGLVREEDGHVVDLTARAGFVRRDWQLLAPWDSEWYYPNTPRYPCDRSDAHRPELALRVDEIPADHRLMAFVARPAGRDSVWGALPDSLNPRATEVFLQLTHERYHAAVGDQFGKLIPAIFTDEPKFFAYHPYTTDLVDGFRDQYGYDLRPQLWRLFSRATDEAAMRVRLDYRAWCGERFRTAWVEPVSNWCRDHGLALVGHISPEDDPVQQSACVGNLFPLYRYFDLPGLDLIIPAVGDQRHPIINIGVIAAVSAAQQQDKPGVMSETLGASGLDATVADAGRILRWQTMMGVTSHVIHCAFNSVAELRKDDAPPDWGPLNERWPAMVALGHDLAELQPVVRGTTQMAPVAVLWPIRSFSAMPFEGYTHDSPLRDELVELVRLCLDRQVGIQLLDEADLWTAEIEGGRLTLGCARYDHVILPPSLIWHTRTLLRLHEIADQGLRVQVAGERPAWQQTDTGIEPANLSWCEAGGAEEIVTGLPRLVDWAGDTTDLRCTAWEDGSEVVRLAMNLRPDEVSVIDRGQEHRLQPGQVHLLR